jgi:hypothetical protein
MCTWTSAYICVLSILRKETIKSSDNIVFVRQKENREKYRNTGYDEEISRKVGQKKTKI